MDDAFLANLLNDVTRARESAFGVPEDNLAPQEDLRALVRAWVSERGAPELLPYPSDLMERTMTRMRRQVCPQLTCDAAEATRQRLTRSPWGQQD